MKLLLIVRWPVGGIRTYINYIFKDWNSDTLEVDLVLPLLREPETILGEHPNIVVTYHQTQSANPTLVEFANIAHGVTRSRDFDLIHAHGFTSGISIAWKLPFLRTPSILTSHDVLNETQFRGTKGVIKSFLIPKLFNRFDIINSVSSDAQNNLLSMLPSIAKDKCVVITNGVDVMKFSNVLSHDIRKDLNIPKEKRILGFFGRFMSQKGFRYLVDAIEILEDKYPNRYQVVCFGSGGFVREEKAALERRRLDHLFHFYDFIPNVGPYIKGCDAVIAPSLWEACPLLPMEVLCSGIPLVATRCIGQREVCENTPSIMVEPGSATSLADGIVAADETPKVHFLDYSFEAQKRFNVRRTQNQIWALYNQLVKLK